MKPFARMILVSSLGEGGAERIACRLASEFADTGRYIITIRYKESLYSVRYNEPGYFYYVSDRPDPRFKLQAAATEKDISESAIFDPSAIYRKIIRDRYRKNQVKFRTLKCREAAIHYMAGK